MAITSTTTTKYGHEIVRPTPSRVRPVSYDDVLARHGAWRPQKARALRCRTGGYIWDRIVLLIGMEAARLGVPNEYAKAWVYKEARRYVDEVIDGDLLPSEAARLAARRLHLHWANKAACREEGMK